ncbi:AMP-binding enzyme, associated with serine palmitoyltransferase [hydrothermal vent metagenome]|uniref:AMP-binding enzyme, associated with serine palmitoyltransferase n=1 Tax=hydrothermal vent metagenome TaxID=652676 RepID=A0A3B0SAN8_9ZZZZ
MLQPTSSNSGIALRLADFATLGDALDYAATGDTGLNFYSARKGLVETLPYAELRQRALDLAGRLLGSGLVAGDRVAMVAETDADFATTFFACQYAGLLPAPLPLPVAFGGKDGYIDHIRRIALVCGASAIFCPNSLSDWIKQSAQTLDLVWSGSLDDFLSENTKTLDLPDIDPEGLSYLQFSSGTTRFPLGVEITHKAFMANASAIAKYGLGITAGDRTCSWLPFYHDMGLVGFLLTPVVTQMSNDLLPTRDFARRPLMWLSMISDNKATLAFTPSFGFDLCTRRAAKANLDHLDLSHWRVAGIGGDMIRVGVLERFIERFAETGFKKTTPLPSYGMAETTLAISFVPVGQGIRYDRVDLNRLDREKLAVLVDKDSDVPAREFVLCGPVLPGHQMQVRDDSGKVLGEAQVGRIYVAGPSLMRKYFGNAGETACVMSKDGWLDTGDLGYFRDDQIVITGRAKDLILINGRNVWPQDLEWSAESSVDGLRSGDVAAFSIDDGGQEEVVLLVQTRVSDPKRRSSLLKGIEGLVNAEYGLTTQVVAVPPHSLPQTSSGKLSRSKARKMYLEGTFEALRRERSSTVN